MKKLFSTLSIILVLGVVTATAQCCSGKSAKHPANCDKSNCEKSNCDKSTCTKHKETQAIKAYYFHGTRRCATCQAVESVTKKALKEYYGDKIILQSLNIEDDANKALVNEFQVTGQALLIVNGDKKVNLTNSAFMNALNNPDKLKQKIKATIDGVD